MIYEVTSHQQFNQIVNNQQKNYKAIICLFTANWCPSCQYIYPEYERMSNRFTDVLFLKVDVDKLKTLRNQAGIKAMPTFIIYNNGRTMNVVNGGDKKQLIKLLDSYSAMNGNHNHDKTNHIYQSHQQAIYQQHQSYNQNGYPNHKNDNSNYNYSIQNNQHQHYNQHQQHQQYTHRPLNTNHPDTNNNNNNKYYQQHSGYSHYSQHYNNNQQQHQPQYNQHYHQHHQSQNQTYSHTYNNNNQYSTY